MTSSALNNLRIRITSEYEDLWEIVLPCVPWDPKKGFVAKNSKQKISRFCPLKAPLLTISNLYLRTRMGQTHSDYGAFLRQGNATIGNYFKEKSLVLSPAHGRPHPLMSRIDSANAWFMVARGRLGPLTAFRFYDPLLGRPRQME